MTAPTVQARIETDRATRYLTQLIKHATAMAGTGGHRIPGHKPITDEVEVTIESSETDGVIAFGSWGRCTLHAGTDALTAHIDAADEEKLARIQTIIGRNLDRFARREGITVDWQRTDDSRGHAAPDDRPAPATADRRRLAAVAVPAVVAALAIALHLGLGAAVLTNGNWIRGTAGLILVLVLAKAAVVLGGIAFRRKWSHRSHQHRS